MKKIKLGIFIGRFQPFHNGHLKALKYSLSRCERLIVGIGSSQESGTYINPLSSNERIRIIKASLKGAKVDTGRIKFLKIPDFHNNEKWFNYIIKKEPTITAVFSRTPLVIRIFKDNGITTVQPQWHRRDILKATKIRKIIRSGKRWEDRVPKSAVREISAHKEKIKSSDFVGGRRNVVIGGTFGYLHKGHLALISKAFKSGDFVYLGLTTDKYVHNVKPHQHLPRYSERRRTLISVLKKFGKGYMIKPLSDRYGPTLTGKFDVIVVSEETFPTALEINRIRRGKGLRRLTIVKIGYVLAEDSLPISTSRIIKGEIDREGNRI